MNIYVGNLSYDSTEDEFRKIFEGYGSVSKVTLTKDRETGKPKGFGFIEMENDAEAEKAIAALDGTPVKGRDIKVNQSRPKKDKPKSNRKNR